MSYELGIHYDEVFNVMYISLCTIIMNRLEGNGKLIFFSTTNFKLLFLLFSPQENKTDVLKQIMFYNVSAYTIKILIGT